MHALAIDRICSPVELGSPARVVGKVLRRGWDVAERHPGEGTSAVQRVKLPEDTRLSFNEIS